MSRRYKQDERKGIIRHAAPEAFAAMIEEQRAAIQDAERNLRWMVPALQVRLREIRDGSWPPKKEQTDE